DVRPVARPREQVRNRSPRQNRVLLHGGDLLLDVQIWRLKRHGLWPRVSDARNGPGLPRGPRKVRSPSVGSEKIDTMIAPHDPDTMLAAVLYGSEDLRMERVPVPRAGPGELVLRVDAALTCGTDLKVYRRGYHAMMLTPPIPF